MVTEIEAGVWQLDSLVLQLLPFTREYIDTNVSISYEIVVEQMGFEPNFRPFNMLVSISEQDG